MSRRWIATAGVRTGFAMTGYKSCGAWSAAGLGHLALRILWGAVQGWAGRPGGRPLRERNRESLRYRAGQNPAPTEGYKECGKTGRRGNRRSAASGGRSELISRKCPDWRPQQWPGIGWHDGGQPPPPTEGLHGVWYGGVKFSEFLGCCTGEGNGGGNGEEGEGIGENYKEV